jgi:TetR/AcrR family transcriptional regulator
MATRRTRKEQISPERSANLSKAWIVVEGARVFNSRGYFGTTLDDIARVLGVTKAALYYYIKTKEELLYECHKTGLEIALQGVKEAISRSPAPDVQLRVAISYFVQNVTDRLKGAVVLLEQGSLSRGHLKEILLRRDEYEQKIRRIINAGINSGVFVECDPKLIGFAILGATNWVNKWYDPSGPRTAQEIGHAFATYLVRGLLRSPSAVRERANAGSFKSKSKPVAV